MVKRASLVMHRLVIFGQEFLIPLSSSLSQLEMTCRPQLCHYHGKCVHSMMVQHQHIIPSCPRTLSFTTTGQSLLVQADIMEDAVAVTYWNWTGNRPCFGSFGANFNSEIWSSYCFMRWKLAIYASLCAWLYVGRKEMPGAGTGAETMLWVSVIFKASTANSFFLRFGTVPNVQSIKQMQRQTVVLLTAEKLEVDGTRWK